MAQEIKEGHMFRIFENKNQEKKIKEAIIRLVDIQKEIGVGSLASSKTNQVLWSMYANNYEGFCIEYEIPEQIKDLYKVQYTKEKNFDIIEIIISDVLDTIYSHMFNTCKKINLVEAVKKIPLTKFYDWRFQKEWRFIGKSREYVYLPIKAVYLGKNMSEKHESQIITIAKRKKYKVYKCFDDYENLKIKYKKIL